MPRRLFAFLLVLLLALLSGCAGAPGGVSITDVTPTPAPVATDAPTVSPSPSPVETATPSPDPEAFAVTSAGFVNGVIQDAYGERAGQTLAGIPTRSFEVSFANVPEGTVCVALCMIDPDAGDWVHWLVANAPVEGLAENASIDSAATLLQGLNGSHFPGYAGPTPPGGTHTYVLTAYALSEGLGLESGFSYTDFTAAVEGKVLAVATLTGTYTH